MRRLLMFVFAFFLLPFYPLLRAMKKMGEKVQFGEKVVVVITTEFGQKKILFK